MSSLIWGTAQTYDINATLENKIVRFSDSRIGVTWIRDANDTQRGALYSLSGNSLSHLSENYVSADRYYNTEARLDIAGINSDQAVVAILDNNRYFYVIRSYRSGDQIYVESAGHQPWSIFPPSWPTVCTIDPSNRKIATAWRDVTNNRIRLRVGSYSSDFSSLNWGTVYNVPSSASAAYIKIIQVDTDKFALVYKRGISPNRFVYARAITVSGNDINVLGNELQIDDVDNPRFINCCSSDTNKIAIVWDNDGVDGRAIACSITGTTIIKGNKIQFTSNGIRANACDGLTSERFIIAYQDFTDSNKGKTVFCKVNWTTLGIEYESPILFSNNSIGGTFNYGIGIIKGDSDTVVLTYSDLTDGDKGKIVAGNFTFPPDPPININAVAGNLQNTISWDSSEGATSYNLYYKKDKAPNNYFNNLDDFTEFKEIGTETSSIVSGAVRLDIPSGSSYSIAEIYEKLQGSGDFEATIDVLNYNPDDTTNGVRAHFRIITYVSQPWPNNFFNIYFNQSGASQYSIDCTWRINGSNGNTGSSTIGIIPTKLRIKRIGTTLYGYYYTTTWNLFGSIDFGSYSSQLQSFTPFINDLNNNGGSVDFDNLIITPSVKDSGTKIADVTSPHIHDSLDYDHVYCYEVTAENATGESDTSLEVNAIPILPIPDPPTNINVTPGTEKNTITWDFVLYATQYNVYWDYSSGVTKATGTKITDVISPHDHFSVPGIQIFYVITAENVGGESDESDEVNGIPLLDAPSNPNASLSGDREITITWTAVTGATKYNIYWLKSPGVTKGIGNKIADITTPYIHEDLDVGDTYYYVITAENSYEEGPESSEVNSIAYTLPDPPSVVSAIATDIQEVTIYWSEVPGADSYNLYYGVFSGINKIVGIKIIDVTEPYIFNAPIPDITYYFFVTSVIGVIGESAESTVVSALSIPPIPNAPLDIVATPGDAKITINFTVSPYADTHHIYWSTNPGVTKATGTKIADVTTLYDFIVPALYQTYYFVVTAENESGESDESIEVSEIPTPIIPNPPENVIGNSTDSGELTISWDVSLYAATYNVYYARLPNVTKATATKIEGVSDLDEIISDLIIGRYYYFAVSAVNSEGESDLSEESLARVLSSLSGQQIFYIKAEAQQNGIIITWSNLQDADKYNLYWSKTTPIDIGTANKIENVTSPYRHYLTVAEDPYYVVTGENDLGESDPSVEANASPKDIEFQSINFLPENLRDYPIFKEFCNVLDYVVDKYHYDNVDRLTGLYDAVHDDFDPDYILRLLGSDYFFEFDLTIDQKRALCLLLSNLYDMKGTKKGLDYVLRLMGLDATVYEWYNINLGIYPEIPETVDPCSIVIDLGLGDYTLLGDEEQKFINLANYLLWVCVKLHGIFWSKKFEDWFEGIEDELSIIEIEPIIVDKFCNWRYNFPEVVIIGPPYDSYITYIGESGLTIGATYFEGYPFLINPDIEEGADTEGVCDPHFIGEPDIYIGGGDISQLTYIIDET